MLTSTLPNRHQQVPVDGAYRRQYRPRRAHQGGRLLHRRGRVPRRRTRGARAAQLPHVQDELLQIRLGVHRGRPASGIRPRAWRRDRQQGLQSRRTRRSVHHGALAGPRLQGQAAAQPRPLSVDHVTPSPPAPRPPRPTRLQGHQMEQVELATD